MATQEKVSATLTAAMEKLNKGDREAARKIATDAATAAETQHGPGAPDTTAAAHDLGMVLAAMEDYDGAEQALRKACVPPPDGNPRAMAQLLTHFLSLGGVLEQVGKIDEAKQVLETCMEARKTAYGVEHPSYAMAMLELGGLLNRQGDFERALELSEEAAAALGRNGQPAISGALVLRAEVLKAMGSDQAPFEGLESLPNDIIEQIAGIALDRAKVADPLVSLLVLRDVQTYVAARMGVQHLASLHLLHAIVGLARTVGDADKREEAWRGMIKGFDERAEYHQAIDAVLALAVAQTEAVKPTEALATLKDGVSRADAAGDRSSRSRVLRNMGVLLRDSGRIDEAEGVFRKALQDGEATKDNANTARAEIALGMLLFQSDRRPEARKLLAAGAAKLDGNDPDARTANKYVTAIDKGEDIAVSGDQVSAAAAIQKMVMESAPAGLLERFEIKFDKGQPDVQMSLKREPSAEELQELENVIQNSIRRVGQAPGAR